MNQSTTCWAPSEHANDDRGKPTERAQGRFKLVLIDGSTAVQIEFPRIEQTLSIATVRQKLTESISPIRRRIAKEPEILGN